MSSEPKRPDPILAPETPPEPGYAEWLDREMAEGWAEVVAGEGIPADEVWKALGRAEGCSGAWRN